GYHGLLIAALPAPLGRVVMLNHLAESLQLPGGQVIQLSGEERDRRVPDLPGVQYLSEFCLEAGLPVWRYQADGVLIEKRVLLVHQQNTVHVMYHLVQGDGPLRLKLRPAVHFRRHDAPVNKAISQPYRLTAVEDRYELRTSGDLPSLRLYL